ncbi:MAG: hypothetical protein PVS3B3_24100 [Ktedonobacteraceae bacterium]
MNEELPHTDGARAEEEELSRFPHSFQLCFLGLLLLQAAQVAYSESKCDNASKEEEKETNV